MRVPRGLRSGRWLPGAVAAVAAMSVALAVVLPAGAHDSSRVEGSWLVDLSSAVDHHRFQVVAGFASGGVFTAIASDTPNATSIGEWAQTGGHHVVGTFYTYLFGAGGALAGTVTIHFTGVVRGATASGTYDSTVIAPGGGPPPFPPDNGPFAAHRIQAGS